jgi:hypothetical protein
LCPSDGRLFHNGLWKSSRHFIPSRATGRGPDPFPACIRHSTGPTDLRSTGSACYNATVTTQQLYLFGCLYLVILAVVAVLTRATLRRIAGALVGGAVAGVALLGIVAIGENAGWWHMAITWEPYFLTVMCIGAIPCGFIFLITWRIARRFGGRGLAVVAFVAAVLGPVRDYRYMATFPEWGAYAPGLAPVFAISVAYVILGILGHGTMRLVAGPAAADRLARWPWEPA